MGTLLSPDMIQYDSNTREVSLTKEFDRLAGESIRNQAAVDDLKKDILAHYNRLAKTGANMNAVFSPDNNHERWNADIKRRIDEVVRTLQNQTNISKATLKNQSVALQWVEIPKTPTPENKQNVLHDAMRNTNAGATFRKAFDPMRGQNI